MFVRNGFNNAEPGLCKNVTLKWLKSDGRFDISTQTYEDPHCKAVYLRNNFARY